MELIFRNDAYARSCEATVLAADPQGIRLDRTVFYPTGGGQPGDSGSLRLPDGQTVPIMTAVKGEGDEVVHIPADGAALPAPGAKVTAEIDWKRRYRHMRMHTCLHLLCAVVPGGVTGGQVGDGKGRLDFDLPEQTLDKDAITDALNRLIEADRPVQPRWISDEELARNPDLVRTMSVKPPVGTGSVRVIDITDTDLQPCGGTHVRRTAEIGRVVVTKIEKKGRHNRRVNVAFADEAASMSYTKPEALVGTEWLAAHIGDPDIRIVDGSHHLPTAGRNARAEYEQQHIPGAVFFDIDAIADPDTDLPHMLPSAETFAADVGRLGIGNRHKVVVYDTIGTTGAARVWWTFRVFGHTNVAVLDGGLPKWLAESRPTDANPVAYPPEQFTAHKDERLVRSLAQIRANIDSRREQVLDARSAGRFNGTEPEPRPGMRGGHIPGSLNLPYPELLAADRTFRPTEELRRAFERSGLDLNKPVVTTCGSGVTAAVLALGLYLLGRDDVAVYDGSWSEWGSRKDTPIEP